MDDCVKEPLIISNNVGHFVGDILGMGSELYGSLFESTCVTLVMGSKYLSDYGDGGCIYYPLIIFAFAIIGSFLTLFSASTFNSVN